MKTENILVFFSLVIHTSTSETKGKLNVLPTVLTPFTLQRKGMSTSSRVLTLDNENGNSEPDSGNHNSLHQEAAASTKPYVTDCNTGNKDTIAVTNQISTSPTTAAITLNTVMTSQANTDSIFSSSSPGKNSHSGIPSVLGEASSQPPTQPGYHDNHLTLSTPVSDVTSTSHVITPIQSSVHLSTPDLFTSTQPLSTDQPHTSATVHAPAGVPHHELPPELNVGDEDQELPPSSPLDPLLAGLVSVFIITTAVVFVVLFLKMRRRTDHPEFHRLQDLPMDDMMEDTPLSRYTYTY